MNIYNPSLYKKVTKFATLLFVFLASFVVFGQDNPAVVDSLKTTFSMGNLEMPNPNSIESKYRYDAFSDRYIYTESVGDFNINYPIILTPKEFQDLVLKDNLKSYYKDKIDATNGKKGDSEEKQKNLLPEFYVKSGLFESIFGGSTVEVVPQGSIEMDLGLLYTKQDNPAFSPRNRSNLSFDFDQRISLSLLGKVGTRLQVTANYDTQSTFDFQNLIKLEFTPTEDDIIQKIEVGNVSMPLNSSLITGAQSLFGVKTQLRFGKTTITGVFAEQKSDTRTVVAQGGGTLDEFDFFIRDYDENRHFFLAHYFRENYDKALQNYPYIQTNIQITRAEVWITNRSNRTENVRNVVGLQDLGETNRIGNPGVTVLAAAGAFPDNANNGLDPTNIGGANSQLTEAARDIATVQNGIAIPGVNEGFDYAKLENTRKLTEGQQYTINTQLGYISLNQRLNNDEVLAVAFQYTVAGEVFQVGEFANDGIGATDVDTNSDGGVTNVSNNALLLKLLKSSVTSTSQPIWDLMMKNIYNTGAYQLSQEDFKLNIFYNEATPLNYIIPAVDGGTFGTDFNGEKIEETTLLRLFNLDRLNFNNDPQTNGDGFFDFVTGITVIPQNGKIVFTKAEPFGRYLFDVLADPSIPTNYNDDVYANPNQEKYVYDLLYKQTKTAALEEIEKNKFQIKGRYKSQGGDGIPIGGFNIPRGSVKVTAGGRLLVEGVDYTVNYQLGRVQILDEALKASNTPIEVSTENNSIFGQQTKRFTGLNVEHKFSENFLIGGTFLNLKERPITQKADFNREPINNTVFGINGNYSTEVPFLTRLANKLPNVDTDAPSNFSVRGEFAYLLPGSPDGTSLNGEATSYIDDFEGTQNGIDLKSPQSWSLSSRPINVNGTGDFDGLGISNGYGRALLNWYTIDQVFFSNRRPDGINDEDISSPYTSRVFLDELFPEQDIAQGQTTVLNTLDLSYYPTERGPYNFDEANTDIGNRNVITDPQKSWGGITRQISSTDFEQANVEYIEFWVQDPFIDNPNSSGGKLVFNLGNISEDVLKDGRKQYENGLPENGDISLFTPTQFQSVVPQNQALTYTFGSTGQERTNQDVGFDGYDDAEEAAKFPEAFNLLPDPANDNYTYFLNTEGGVLERYKRYNGTDGNSPETFSDTNRASYPQPDVEDINRDNTMNTIDSYFQYTIEITPANLPNSLSDITAANPIGEFIRDIKKPLRLLENGDEIEVPWYQFRIPVKGDHAEEINGITDLRSIRFARVFLNGFTDPTVFRFGSLDLVRSDWRRYTQILDDGTPGSDTNTDFSVGAISTIDNDGDYESPPGIDPERQNNNNTIVRQNEQALVVSVCGLEDKDSRAVYKNIDIDMRQFKRLRMFMHAEPDKAGDIEDGDLVGFIRLGNDLTQNYYQVEVPLEITDANSSDGSQGDSDRARRIWPLANEVDLQLEVLQKIKSAGINEDLLGNGETTFYEIGADGEPIKIAAGDEFGTRGQGIQYYGIKGNPNFGAIRTLMVGIKNVSGGDACGEVWYNELRMSEMDNEGGWAAVMSMDTNLADFANVSATGRMSTAGFGAVEQGPNERSREDIKQYDVVTNVNMGQLLPKKWGIQVPFNYGQGEEIITPEYDQQYKDLELDTRLDQVDGDDNLNAEEKRDLKNTIKKQSEDYTKRRSINFIGVRKNRTGDSKPRFYDVENLTANYSYNKVNHRDFEIESSVDKQVALGLNYAYNFEPKSIEPFAKNDSIFTGKYWKLLKDFNVNLLPASFTVGSNLQRQFNKQKFRDIDLGGNNIAVEELFRRNYTYDFQYNFNWNLTSALQFNYSSENNKIVRNYFINDQLNGAQNPELDVWDGFLDFGDPNRHYQQLGLNYELPLNKIPVLSFLKATYSYTGEFQWQKGSDLVVDLPGYEPVNAISNGNSHTINSTLDMNKLYKYVGLTKKKSKRISALPKTRGGGKTPDPKKKNKKVKTKSKKRSKAGGFAIDMLTMVKRIQVNYSENNGTFLPGFTRAPGFLGTTKPTLGYVLGNQSDVRQLSAENGWLTRFDLFNEQYTDNLTRQLDISANIEPIKYLKIDLVGFRTYAENATENFRVDGNLGDLEYVPLTPNTFGNMSISTFTLPTAFETSDETSSAAFDAFSDNRLVIARRLAFKNGVDFSNPINFDNEGFPRGFGKTSQAVLLPAFISAYSGQKANKTTLDAIKDIPIPNWDLKYTGFMKLKWFKKRFKRFSLTHGYRSSYTINQFRTNLDFKPIDFNKEYISQPNEAIDQAGNYKNEDLYSNVNIAEMFSPLVRMDFEMKNSIKILGEIRKDRLLSLSFDNNLLTEVQGQEYKVGLGYRFKDVKLKTKLAGPKKSVVSDLLMELNASLRDNKTIIRYLDIENNQITNGQTIFSLTYNANYSFSKNLIGIFYFDYSFSEYAISTAFPQTTIRSGFTLKYNFGN